MRKHWPAPVAAALAAAALYGLLAAVEPRLPVPEDPWMDAWRQAGLEVELQAVSQDPAHTLGFREAREIFDRYPLEASAVRRYSVSGMPVDVVSLPERGFLEEFPEGTHLKYRTRAKGPAANVCRSGRHLMIIPAQWNFGFFPMKADEETVGRVLELFEAAAARRE